MLAEMNNLDGVEWDKWHIFWVDERCVPHTCVVELGDTRTTEHSLAAHETPACCQYEALDVDSDS